MATIGSFGGIDIDSTELLSFGLDISVLYSQLDRPFNSSYLAHTGLSARRLQFTVEVQTQARFNPWMNLHENYDKLQKQLILAQNNEGFWMIESLDIDFTEFAAQIWRVSLSLVG